MTPEAQIWRDYFTVWEADQLRRHPIPTSFTPLEQAQYELGMDYFQDRFSLDELRGGTRYSNTPIVINADAPTRRAFFAHFKEDRVINIFCWRSEEWDSIAQRGMSSSRDFSYFTAHHIFFRCSTMNPLHLDSLCRIPLPQELSLNDLFVRSSSGLSISGSDSVWHWDREKLVHLPQYDSNWMF
ncbi:hypothetical protein EON83_18800 [bacterium]|nr:MAG: hypothetical protein EON83_18800 [bacterium]